ncbi:crotonase/enoyl-CoA hydratase family protein [Flavobacterium sedimenticola]|uniref:Crotonase/enoyl-CoA hydratase family protein n=1 Tax=Flavobacterium sedimenticola TaxID=3043286 RepID=A0ABT6XSE5_9FLAO|nr:crotonase/enoyl-CoA hydratase family protein [Flavobacterium sedimenticola]MDI9257895.1 crotonase/enoyl-CoA hydratase family protein [Flavobacterium sedimenticola]
MNYTKNLDLSHDKINSVLWLKIGVPHELHYSYKTICDFYEELPKIKKTIINENIKFLVIKSPNPTVWNMGGDLEFFIDCIKQNNYPALKDYAYKCVEGVHMINKAFETSCSVICLLEGNAYGGGFECALSADYIIAEEQVKCSFPETIFDTFPGMGAYSFLTRKVGYEKAHQLIQSNQKWEAKDLEEMNLIWKCVEKDCAITTLLKGFKEDLFKPKNEFEKACKVPPKEELLTIVDIWLNGIMNLDEKTIAIMEKIVANQKKLVLKQKTAN